MFLFFLKQWFHQFSIYISITPISPELFPHLLPSPPLFLYQTFLIPLAFSPVSSLYFSLPVSYQRLCFSLLLFSLYCTLYQIRKPTSRNPRCSHPYTLPDPNSTAPSTLGPDYPQRGPDTRHNTQYSGGRLEGTLA